MHSVKQSFIKGIWAQVIEFLFLLCLIFLIRTFGFGLYQVPSGSMEITMLVGERFFADKISYWFRKPQRGEIIAYNAPTYIYSENWLLQLFEHYVWGPENWTKRVIGIPGDHVRGVVENGKPVVYLNAKKINESYLNTHPLLYVWRDDLKKRKTKSLLPSLFNSKYIVLKSYNPKRSLLDQPFYHIKPEQIMRDPRGVMYMVQPGLPLASNKDVIMVNHNYWDGSDRFNIKLGSNEYWVMGDNRLGSSDSRIFGPISGDTIHGRIVFRIWSVDSVESWWIFDLIKNPINFWKRVRWKRFFQWMS